METTPEKLEMFYEGKAKKLYSTADPDLVIAYFKDDATAFNAKKKGTIEDKGVINNRMSELFFTLLERSGVKTHFVRRLNDREMLCKRLQIIPVETVVRNLVAGSMAKRLGREEGEQLPRPVVEYYYKCDALDDPLILGEHAIAFGWATAEELKTIDTPILVVDGDHDEAIKREHTEYIAATIPGAGLLILPNASHFAFLQDPDLFSYAVLHFLGDRAR